jgi:hypothetical protein
LDALQAEKGRKGHRQEHGRSLHHLRLQRPIDDSYDVARLRKRQPTNGRRADDKKAQQDGQRINK